MKMNAGIWIGLIGGLIGLAVALIAVLTTAGSSGPYISVAMLAIFGGVFFLLFKLIIKPIINAKRLMASGLPGKATITSVNDTGVTINNNPQVKLTLDVKGHLGQRYTTTLRTLVSRINPFVYQPGMEVPVKIDPRNEMNVIIDTSGGDRSTISANSFTQPNETLIKAEIEQLQKDGEAIRVSGRPARAIIKKYNWLGVNVNGNNPYVELDIEVLPENSTSFSGKAKGVISESSVPKYQPGCEIYVKYDLYDNSKIVLDHS
jgi:hypothetical protein